MKLEFSVIERMELISRLFALLTARFENAAVAASKCQGRIPYEDLQAGALSLASIAEEVLTLASATGALPDDPQSIPARVVS